MKKTILLIIFMLFIPSYLMAWEFTINGSDPVVCNDACIRSTAPTTNYGTSAISWFGTNSGTWKIFTAFYGLSDSIALYGTDKEITSAKIVFSVAARLSADGDTLWASIYSCKRVTTQSTITWNKYDGVNDWQTAGAAGANDIVLVKEADGIHDSVVVISYANSVAGNTFTFWLNPDNIDYEGYIINYTEFGTAPNALQFQMSEHVSAPGPQMTVYGESEAPPANNNNRRRSFRDD